MANPTAKEIAALILAGGFGTRIKHLAPDLPKPMIPIHGKPFLEWVVLQLSSQGIEEFVLSTGYLAEKVAEYFDRQPVPGAHVKCAVEKEPLGTGGAILYNLSKLDVMRPWILAGNGDSMVRFDLDEMLAQVGDGVEGVILGLRQDDCSRFGKLSVAAGRLLGFAEKAPGPGVINAGVYLLRRSALQAFPASYPMSIEKDYFPARLAAGGVYHVVETAGPFLDIGTPESLAMADQWIAEAESWLA